MNLSVGDVLVCVKKPENIMRHRYDVGDKVVILDQFKILGSHNPFIRACLLDGTPLILIQEDLKLFERL